ncbi:hypothetical protein ANO11243_091110 [Dothideomycetidae sp. 11243]|nr:hypothetical protein ANO11243_091110 [fungal sp. No.11243]
MSADSKAGLGAICGSLMTLSTTSVFLRLYTRKAQKFAIQADDGFACLGLARACSDVGTIACCQSRLLMDVVVHIKYVGYSSKDVPESVQDSEVGAKVLFSLLLAETASDTQQVQLTYETATILTVAFVKLSALFFYRRVFHTPGVTHWTNRVLLGTVALVISWLVTYIVLTFIQCKSHLDAYWKDVPGAACRLRWPLYLSLPITNLILDVWILLLLVHDVARLRVSMRKRLSVMGVFLLAFV